MKPNSKTTPLPLLACVLALLCSGCQNKPGTSESAQAGDSKDSSRFEEQIVRYSTWVDVNRDSIFIRLGDNSIELVPNSQKYFLPGKGIRNGSIIVLEGTSDTIHIIESSDKLIFESGQQVKIPDLVSGITFTRIEDFSSFMLQFSTDKEFQKSRIRFPLKVIPDSTGIPTHWTPQDWDRNNTFMGTLPTGNECLDTNGSNSLSPAADWLVWRDCDTDVLTRYKFVRRGGIWILSEIYEIGFSG